jgi:plastocyanin
MVFRHLAWEGNELTRALALAAAVLGALAAPAVAAAHHGAQSVVVRIEAAGFVPATVTIRQGDTVVFENRGSSARWPASNIHPTHHIYPDFDPRAPVAPGQRWAFTFDRPGTWNYHDHLAPDVAGSVVVEADAGGRGGVGSVLAAAQVRATGAYRALRIGILRLFYSWFPGRLARRAEALDIRRTVDDESALRDWLALLGPGEVISRLIRDADGGRRFECHQPAHQIGRIAYELYGAAMFQRGDMSCNAGYYHGAMEAFLAERGTADLAADIDRLCSGLPTRFARYSCLHGVGHGVMAYESYDLPRALATCGRLPTEYIRRSCYSGVFMENAVVAMGIGVMPGHQTKWINREDLHFPCNAVGSDYAILYHCYHFQTSWMLLVHQGDFDRVAAECLRARPEMIPVCFDSFGRDAATQALREPARILALCDKAPRDGGLYAKCLAGAVPVITDFWGANLGDQATALCREAPAHGKPACYTTLLGRLMDLFSTPAERRRICQGFEPSYRTLCDQAGAG